MRYGLLFFGQIVGFIILVVNIRALNRGKLLMTGITEFMYMLINFAMIRQVSEAQNWLEALVYAGGATVGSLLAVYYTRHWDTKETS